VVVMLRSAAALSGGERDSGRQAYGKQQYGYLLMLL
jgi:hypothetical protein